MKRPMAGGVMSVVLRLFVFANAGDARVGTSAGGGDLSVMYSLRNIEKIGAAKWRRAGSGRNKWASYKRARLQ